jgi:hypothetical protein
LCICAIDCEEESLILGKKRRTNQMSLKNKKITKILSVGVSTAALTISSLMPVLADTGVEQVDAGLNVIKVLAIGVCETIGVLGLVKGGIDFSTGLTQRDQSGTVTGGLELASGLILCSIGALIGLMGF